MGVYSVRGFTAATVATAWKPVAAVWNPSSTVRVQLLEFGFYVAGDNPGAGAPRYTLATSTGRGTPGSTITPDADNSWDGGPAPPSGLLLDLAAWTPTDPTEDALNRIYSMGFSSLTTGTAGQGMIWTFQPKPFVVKPGTGVTIDQLVAIVTPACEVYAVWEED